MKLLQLSAVEEGFEADFLDAVEFVQALVFDEGGGQIGVNLGTIVLDLIGAGLDEADRTRDSSRERARMAFSTRGVSSIPGIFCFAC